MPREESSQGTDHEIVTIGEVTDVTCPDAEEFRYCPYCGEEL